MSKHEILSFKNRYINYLKNNNGDYNICDWLQNAVDFERPDGYYFDYNTKLLVIFEHFESVVDKFFFIYFGEEIRQRTIIGRVDFGFLIILLCRHYICR